MSSFSADGNPSPMTLFDSTILHGPASDESKLAVQGDFVGDHLGISSFGGITQADID